MSVDLNLTGEGVAAIVAISITGMSSVYAMVRTIRSDHKADERDKIAAAALVEQNKILTVVTQKQEATHGALVAVVDKVDAVAETVGTVQTNVAKVELATNSMKDNLVAAVAHVNLLVGQSQGVAAEKERAGTTDPALPASTPNAADIEAARLVEFKATVANEIRRQQLALNQKP